MSILLPVLAVLLMLWTIIGGLFVWLITAMRLHMDLPRPSGSKYVQMFLLGGPACWICGIIVAVLTTFVWLAAHYLKDEIGKEN